MGYLRPASVRLFGRKPPVVKIQNSAALTAEGYIRQIGLTYQMPDPNKGGQNPPLREVTLLLNPNDARTIAQQLLADADEADLQNTLQGEGGQYTGEYADVMPAEGTRWAARVPKTGTWGRLYAEPGGTGDFTEGLVMEVTSTEVVISDGHTPPGQHTRLPRTSAALSRFVTDDDNWETL